ncbi:TIR domain-containing protein [Phototrophicus methaneseepsis]|uniref:TIR domain-containing protein n=1 Tax=Phototrophicus methaneseepsis TaxID=2710758 RepID=A0A7S8EC15_9CHLR|nr:TIR domain-containing protein [Phototrophicus methaneseepsis]QPC84201.1 TIR domain-containing protein [Phototrophicus methaneseepsis]
MPTVYVAHHQQDIAQVVVARLRAAFGAASVAHSSIKLPPGDDARKAAAKYAARADMVLVLIGPEWAQRIAQAPQNDLVGIATAYALRYEKRIIPVVLPGGRMPTADQLPQQMRDLAYVTPFHLNDTENDIVRLVALLQSNAQPQARPRTEARPTPTETVIYRSEPLPRVTSPLDIFLWPLRFIWWLLKRIAGTISWLVQLIVAQAIRSAVGCIITILIVAVIGGLILWFVVTFLQQDLNATMAISQMVDSVRQILQGLQGLRNLQPPTIPTP